MASAKVVTISEDGRRGITSAEKAAMYVKQRRALWLFADARHGGARLDCIRFVSKDHRNKSAALEASKKSSGVGLMPVSGMLISGTREMRGVNKTAFLKGLQIEQRINERKLTLLLNQILAKKNEPLIEETIRKAELFVIGREKIPSDDEIIIYTTNSGKRTVLRLGEDEPVVSHKSIPKEVSPPERVHNDALMKLLATIHKDLAINVAIRGFIPNMVKAIARIKSERKRKQGKIDRAVLKNDKKWARYIIRHFKVVSPHILQIANSGKRKPRRKVIQL